VADTDTVSEPVVDVMPLAGPADSQFPPLVVAALSVNATAELLLVVTVTFCDAGGVVLPTVAVKVSDAVLSMSVGTDDVIGVVTLRVTGTDNGLLLAPAAVYETLPV
jgi:hypothetical protein